MNGVNNQGDAQPVNVRAMINKFEQKTTADTKTSNVKQNALTPNIKDQETPTTIVKSESKARLKEKTTSNEKLKKA